MTALGDASTEDAPRTTVFPAACAKEGAMTATLPATAFGMLVRARLLDDSAAAAAASICAVCMLRRARFCDDSASAAAASFVASSSEPSSRVRLQDSACCAMFNGDWWRGVWWGAVWSAEEMQRTGHEMRRRRAGPAESRRGRIGHSAAHGTTASTISA